MRTHLQPLSRPAASIAYICSTLLFCLTVSSAFAAPAPQGNAARGAALYATCAACHGPKALGMQAMNAPPLAGQQSWYLNTQLSNFHSGARGAHPKDVYGAQMKAMAQVAAQPQARADLLAHIATLPAPTAEQQRALEGGQTVGGDATRGKSLYITCTSCHGPQGRGNQGLNSPAIHTLPSWYLLRQLRHFKAGIRGAHPKDPYGAQMKAMAMTLADAQAMKDVVAYILSL